MNVKIDKDVLFEFIASHERLAADEYNRNPSYNDEHYSAKAERLMICEMDRAGITEEYFMLNSAKR